MAGTRQPTDLVVLKGKKHFTKSEIEDRKSKEIKAPADKVRAPNYLSLSEKKQFKSIAKELIKIGIMSNLDVDSLSFFIKSRTEYLKITKEVDIREPTKIIEIFEKDNDGNIIDVKEQIIIDEDYTTLVKLQGRLLNQCRKCASDLGLSIASRCRLVVPISDDKKPQNKYSKFL